MRFSWTGLILAPLPVPLAFAAAMTGASPGGRPFVFFLLLTIAGCVVSYGTTIVLFLPSLYLLSARRPLTGLVVCGVGLVLGAVPLLALAVPAWLSSGPDSGPPVEGFVVFLWGWAADPFAAMFPAAGLVTAALYWGLGTWRRRGGTRS